MIEDNFIKVTIKYIRVKSEKKIKSDIEYATIKSSKPRENMNRILMEMRDNPNITTNQLISLIGIN